MMKRIFSKLTVILIFLIFSFYEILARSVLQIENANFELTIASYKYIAVAFYDNSPKGKALEKLWMDAADALDDHLPQDCEIGKIFGADPELREIIDAYSISVPAILVFRKGVNSQYNGPLEDAEKVSNYILLDSEPSVKELSNLDIIRRILSEENSASVVIGLFPRDAITEESDEGYSMDDWGQFQSSADNLRDHNTKFYYITDPELLNSFKIDMEELPVIFLVSNEGEGFLRYSGAIVDTSLTDWIIRNTAPPPGELTLKTTLGQQFVTLFFSSRKFKFILIFNDSPSQEDIDQWLGIAESFGNKAIFSFMNEPYVGDVIEFFELDMKKDGPAIVAHSPTSDGRYKATNVNLSDKKSINSFISNAILGKIPKMIKSEPVPTTQKGPVTKLVGSNLIETVSKEGVDVILVVYKPWCQHCRSLLPVYELLGRAVQGEPRILASIIDAELNDIPSSWGVKSFPALLWFPAKDKPYTSAGIQPRGYWDAGYSLSELVGFVQREGSFEPKTLKVATMEQLSTLAGEEEAIREKYDIEERNTRRNEGRFVYENPYVDWLFGEIAFDGKRSHLLLAAILSMSWLGMFSFIFLSSRQQISTVKKQKAK